LFISAEKPSSRVGPPYLGKVRIDRHVGEVGVGVVVGAAAPADKTGGRFDDIQHNNMSFHSWLPVIL
jgi:hypothetical protein